MTHHILPLFILIVSSFDISFSQRKLPKHSVVSVDVKTAVHFDCPEEFGYYPHPDDCTQYYVCVFGGALLESCTGGLMYSQELQTCDWPRNVGCDGAELAPSPTSPSSSSNSRQKEEYSRTRYTPPPPPKPSALVISRGQPRQQQIYHDDEINLKQQQLYQDSEETLPEAQEEESDRQQRFYRGQPSTAGQVQRDRDGLRQSNAIAYHTGQKEKIGVISFGIHQDHQRDLTDYYLETITDNKLTLTRRKKRQTGTSSNGAPRSWSNVHTSNRVLTPPKTYSRHQTGSDTNFASHRSSYEYRATTDRDPTFYNPRRTDSPSRNHHPSRYLDNKFININQYNSNSFAPTTRLYDSSRDNYYYFHLDPDKKTINPNVDKPYKIKLKYIQPSGFKPSNHTHTDAITRGFEVRNNNKNESSKYSSREKFNDATVKFYNTQNQPNLNLDASAFSMKNFPSPNSANTQKTKEQTKNPTKIHTNKSIDYEYNYYYDEITDLPPVDYTGENLTRGNKFSVNHDYSKNEDYRDLSDRTKFPDYDSKDNLNISFKKGTKYSAKYKEKTSTTKKPLRQESTFLSSSFPTRQPLRQTSSTTASTRISHTETREHITETTITKSPTRSRTRQTTTTFQRGKHRLQVTENNLRNKVVNAVQRSETTTSPPEAVSATARTIVNTSQYYASYEPEYDDKAKYEYNSYNEPQPSAAPAVSYRSRTPAPTYQSVSSQDDIQSSKRTNVIQNDYVRGVYQEQSIPEYHDVTYDNAEDDHNSYRQSNRQPVREDRKETNLIEDLPSTSKSKNRIAVTYASSTSRYSTKKPVKTPTSSISYKQNTVSSSASSNATKENKSQVYPKQSQYLVTGNSNIYTLPTISLSQNLSHHPTDIPYSPVSNSSNNKDIVPSQHNPEIIEPIPLHSIRTSQQIPITYRFITKKPPSKSTDQVSFSGTRNKQIDSFNTQHFFSPSSSTTTTTSTQRAPASFIEYDHVSIINPTTFSPPKLYFKSLLPKYIFSSSIPARPNVTNFDYASSFSSKSKIQTDASPTIPRDNYQQDYSNKANKAVKFIKKIVPINPETLNQELLSNQKDDEFSSTSEESLEISTSKISVGTEQVIPKTTQRYAFIPKRKIPSSSTFSPDDSSEDSDVGFDSYSVEEPDEPPTITASVEMVSKSNFSETSKSEFEPNTVKSSISIQDQLILEKINRYKNSSLINPNYVPKPKFFKSTVEVPPIKSLLSDQDSVKEEPDLPPTYKLKPFKLLTKNSRNKTESSFNTTTPRISRINPAFKFMMNSFRGTKGHNTKCNESTSIQICSDLKQLRTSNRGRGSGHYTSGNVVTNDVTANSINVNRGTPPPRSRPTLKPSTSIVSKAQEFVDIYRYPPRRPDPIYPQPQPDKTAAKCRKDVCLLPDCNCGGKDIPGDIPPEQVPQIVLLTFDDSVNDLNKGLYQDLFEKGRVNPNGCPISATFYVSHEWTDYSQVQNLYSDGHEIASHTVSHSFGEQFSQKKWTREIAGQREILAAYGGVHLEDVRGMRAPFLSVGGNKMFKMLYDSNFTYDSSMPIYENKPPSWPYTLDYKLFHDCMIPPCPTRSYPGVWEVPMVMWQDLNGGRCSMGDACSNPADAEGVHKMIMKNFQRHYTTNRAPFGLFYHAAWFTQAHHKEGFINFLDNILAMRDVWVITNWQAVEWVRDPTPTSRLGSFKPFQCDYADRPKRCNNPKVCNLWHKSGVRYMRTCQPCPDIYPWTGNSGIRSSRIDNDIED